jgi:dihydroneopterin aldolase
VSDTTQIRGLRVLGRHGAYEFEREYLQPFEVDLDFESDVRKPGVSDALEDAVSYADIVTTIRSVIEGESYNLIERIATRIADEVLRDHRIQRVDVTVRKLQPALDGDLGYAAVRISRP